MIKESNSTLTVIENLAAITEGIFALAYRHGKISLDSAEMINDAAKKILFEQQEVISEPKHWALFRQNPNLAKEITRQLIYTNKGEITCTFSLPTKHTKVNIHFYKEDDLLFFTVKNLSLNRDEDLAQQYKSIFENAPQGQLIVSLNGTVETVNTIAQLTVRLYLNQNVVEGDSIEKFRKARGYEQFNSWCKQAFGGTITQKEIRLDLAHSKRVWIKLRIAPIYEKNKQINSILITGSDITIRKDSERRLEENKEKLNAIFESSYDALIIVGDGLRMILDCNQRALQMFEKDIKGQAISTLSENICFKKNQHEIKKALLDSNVFLQELEYTSASGRRFWGSTAISSISIGHNKFKLIRITDITEQKQMEADLLEAKEKALALGQVKDQFLASMSHEIRTPLNGVIGAINLLDSNHALNPEQYTRTVKTLRFSAQHLLTLINDILDFNKIESNKVTLDTHNFNFNSLVREIAQTFTFRAQEKNILLFTSFDTNIPKNLVGDSLRIVQIISNLVNNAIKFTPQGTVRVCTKLLAESSENVCIKVEVTDTGIGIASQNLDKIFDVFTQAENNTSRRFGGTGLGLAIVKRLLHLMNSEIHVESTEGLGSTFAFELTLNKSTSTPIKDDNIFNEKKTSFAPLPDMRLLVAEDNEINRYVICNFLNEWTVQYDIAVNGQEVLDLLHKNTYDMVLMDLQMPIIDGIEASRRIRINLNNIPIIALTAATLPNTTNYLQDNGINDYLAKPFDAYQLYNLIYKWGKKKDINPVHSTNTTNTAISKQQPMFHNTTDVSIDFDKMLFACRSNLEEEVKCLDMYLHYFKELSGNYEQAIRMNNAAQLSNWIHNIKPIMAISGISDNNLCSTLLQDSRRLANEPPFNEEQFAVLKKQFDELCTNIITQIQKRKEQITS